MRAGCLGTQKEVMIRMSEKCVPYIFFNGEVGWFGVGDRQDISVVISLKIIDEFGDCRGL